MNRRSFLSLLALPALRGLPEPRIRDISVIATSPEGLRLVVVKVTTDQPGLYGYGCATFTQRADLVVAAVEKYLRPLMIGRPATRIEDAWNMMYNSSYWRNGPVLNNAISGVDQALWDILGRQANMPVYQLLGGKVREGAAVYGHASGAEIPQVMESAKRIMALGIRHVRVQVGIPGMDGYGGQGGIGGYGELGPDGRPKGVLHSGPLFEPNAYIKRTLKLLETARKELGDDVELLHDTHERIHPRQAVQLCKDVEQFKLFFLEDPVSPEDINWFRQIRAACTTPLAMGELFNSPHEWTPLIKDQLIDYIRIHISQIGGLTPARKVAAMAEPFYVRTAWHGPGDTSPIGHACNVTLDCVVPNFGIQEWSRFSDEMREVFSGVPEMRDGFMYPSDKPGWGIEVNEKAAAKYPFGHKETPAKNKLNGGWRDIRRSDGSIIKQ